MQKKAPQRKAGSKKPVTKPTKKAGRKKKEPTPEQRMRDVISILTTEKLNLDRNLREVQNQLEQYREMALDLKSKLERKNQQITAVTRHFLKSTTRHFQDVISGSKTMEARKADRDFYIGESILLQEYCPHTERYSGREQLINITNILTGTEYGIMPGYVMISFETGEFATEGRLSKMMQFQRSNGAQTTQDLLSPTALQS